MKNHLEAFFTWLGDVTPNTRRTYANDLAHFGRWFEERHGQPPRVDDLTQMTVVLYKAAMVDKLRLKPSTVKRRLSTLTRFSRWASEAGYIEELPAKKVKIPPVPRERPTRLDPAVIRALLHEAQRDPHKLGARNYAILRVLVDTGLRVGALVALRLSDINQAEQAATLTVRGGKGQRASVIPLPLSTQSALEDYLAVRPDTEDDHVFVSIRGGGLDTDTVGHVLNKYAAKAGIDPRAVSPRLLRHTAMTNIPPGRP